MLPSTTPSQHGAAQDAPTLAMSIRQLARVNCRERLLVAPLFWMNRQLELLQCSFSDPMPTPPFTIESNLNNSDRSDTRIIKKMVYYWNSRNCEDAIEDLVLFLDCPLKPGYVVLPVPRAPPPPG